MAKNNETVSDISFKNHQRKYSKQRENTISLENDLDSIHKEMTRKPEAKRGLIYITHIPRILYEKEMENYFRQFGRVTNIKICRSRINKHNQGFGYIEFEHPEAARMAAKTKNNDFMFKNKISTQYVPYHKRPKELFQKMNNKMTLKSRTLEQQNSRNKVANTNVAMRVKTNCEEAKSKTVESKSLGIQCSLDVDYKILKEVKLEKESNMNTSSKESMYDNKFLEGTNLNGIYLSQHLCSKLLEKTKSNKIVLTKSLDSVKTFLNNGLPRCREEETQTPTFRTFKKERYNKNIIFRANKKVKKVNKDINKLAINKNIIKKIARELIRKRGQSFLTLRANKPRKSTKRK